MQIKNTDNMETNTAETKQTAQNKTTLVQSLFITLGQEMMWPGLLYNAPEPTCNHRQVSENYLEYCNVQKWD